MHDSHAGMVKSVDTRDLKSLAVKSVPVRVRLPAPINSYFGNKMAVFCFVHKEIIEITLCFFLHSGQNLKNRICGIDLGSKFLMHINICRGGNCAVAQP